MKKRDENEEYYPVSLKEIAVIFFLFLFMLIFLFPKETLKEKVLKEKKSNDLALIYIENMIKFDPSNYKLLLHFADISLKEDNFYAVKAIVDMLLRAPNKEARESAIALGAKLFKRQYFLLKNKKDREKLLKEYKDTLFDMAVISHDEKLQEEILNYFQTKKEKREYEKLLKRLSLDSVRWKIVYGDYLVGKSLHKKAFLIYKEALEESIDKSLFKKVFYKLLSVAVYGGLFNEAMPIVEKYQDEFVKEEKISKKILEFYLAADQIKKARKYALLILKNSRKK